MRIPKKPALAMKDVIKSAQEYIQWELIDWTNEDFVREHVRDEFKRYIKDVLDAEFLQEQGEVDYNLKPLAETVAKQVKLEDIQFSEEEIKEITDEIKSEIKLMVKDNVRRTLINEMNTYASKQTAKMHKSIAGSMRRLFDQELEKALYEEDAE